MIAKYLLKLSPAITNTQKTHATQSGASGTLVGKNYNIVQLTSLTVFGKILKKKKNKLNKEQANVQLENKIVYRLKRNPEIWSI